MRVKFKIVFDYSFFALYRKQYGRGRPAVVMSIEGKVDMERRKRLAKRARTQASCALTVQASEDRER